MRLTLAFLLATPATALAQATLLAAVTLPDAPQPTIASPEPLPQNAAPKPPPKPLTIVNGRPYTFPTARQQFQAYEFELLSTRSVLHAAIRAGFEQIKPTPAGWGTDFPGYMQRFGDAYGEAAISNTVRYGLSQALHEDDRYLLCHHCSVGQKFANAALSEVTARRGTDGHRTFSPTPISASLSGPLAGYALWYPEGERNAGPALRHVVFNVSSRVIFNTLREFLFDHDTPEERGK